MEDTWMQAGPDTDGWYDVYYGGTYVYGYYGDEGEDIVGFLDRLNGLGVRYER